MDGDGRSVVKVRHRQAILAAAADLIQESEGTRFSADELAARAGVSRRTIFNHFASLDDVLLGVCTETLHVVAEQLRLGADTAHRTDLNREAMFLAVAQALRGAQLSGPVIRVWRALGGIGEDSDRTQAFAQQALALVADELAAQVTAGSPEADHLDVTLLTSLLTHGLGVIGRHWVETAPPGRPPSREEWDLLLEHLLDVVGSGYLPRTPTAQ